MAEPPADGQVDPRFVTHRHVVQPSADSGGAIPIEETPGDPPTRASAIKLCPSCSHAMDRVSVICTHCGHDERKGLGVGPDPLPGEAAPKRRGLPCPECGYDLTGLREPRCPECGNEVNLRRVTREADAREKKRITVEVGSMWRPAIILGVSLLVCIIALLAREGPKSAFEYPIVLGIQSVCGLVAYWLIGVMWMGFDAPLRAVFLQVASVFAASDASGVLLAAMGAPMLIWWPLALAVYVLLLYQELDIDAEDVVPLIIAIYTVKVVLGQWLLAPLIGGLLGTLYAKLGW